MLATAPRRGRAVAPVEMAVYEAELADSPLDCLYIPDCLASGPTCQARPAARAQTGNGVVALVLFIKGVAGSALC